MTTVTRPQIVDLKANLWPAACKARGWNPKDREFEMATYSDILERPITSSSEIGKMEEFTAVKTQLVAWTKPDDFNRTYRNVRNPRRVLEHKIVIEQAALLAVVLKPAKPDASEIERQFAAEKYIIDLMEPRFHTTYITQVSEVIRPRFYPPSHPKAGLPTGEEKSDLECLRDTLAARINALRKERGWSIHQMNQQAGIACPNNCTQCRPKPVVVLEGVPA